MIFFVEDGVFDAQEGLLAGGIGDQAGEAAKLAAIEIFLEVDSSTCRCVHCKHSKAIRPCTVTSTRANLEVLGQAFC